MNDVYEERLIELTKKIVDAPKSAFSIIGVILQFKPEDYKLLRDWYKLVSGHELDVVVDAIDVREMSKLYLSGKNIEVPEDKELTTEQFNPKTSGDFFRSWSNDDMSSGRGSR